MSSIDSKSSLKSFSKKRHVLLVKLLGMLSLVRWYNILLIIIALYLSSLYILDTSNPKIEILNDLKLHLNIMGISALLMAGYIINAFYDFEKDMINHPEKTVFGRIISKAFCLNTYIGLLLIGFLLSAFSDWKVFIFNAGFSFGLWFYSHKLRKKALTSEMGASILTIAPFASISLYYMKTNSTILLFVGYIFAITFTREVIKKMVSLKGDLIVGEKSIPIIFGIRNTKYIILILMILSLCPISVIFPNILYKDIAYYFGASFLMIIISMIMLNKCKTPTHFNQINRIYKIILVLGVASIILY